MATYRKTAPIGDDVDATRVALSHIVTGEALLAHGGVMPSANSWDEVLDEGAGTLTLILRVDDDPRAT